MMTDANELVKRLRNGSVVTQEEAAAALEAKDREIARLRKALEPVRTFADEMSEQALCIGLIGTSDWYRVVGSVDIFGIQDKARAALTLSYHETPLEDVSDETLEQLHKSGQLPEGRYDEEKRRRSSK